MVQLAGTTVDGFDNAVRVFRSDLFVTNSWQHRLPEYVVAGPKYEPTADDRGGLNGVLGAGYWSSTWEYRDDAGYVDCPGGNLTGRPR